ncbi:MAG: hypothetical protein NC344_09145 [Bacteroidales bacterium]|nr:hypothetical protein [Bacteroidales bacterium]MCM1147975.1 hypothetical protein [Bacteroidales bacterium]MCM1206899.1 hypothetical protein [Bacillota bacterium]MCM1509532.1 hypothetical protein [Clostridium sp.]
MEKNNSGLQTRRQFFKKAACVSLPMLGLIMSGCDTFQSALMNSVSNIGSGGGYSSGGGYDSYGCGNYCTSTCKNLCTDTCRNLCTNTCYHTSA